MINPDKKNQQRSCNCKNSKCMKLYCECFAAQVPCNKNCRCIDCRNTSYHQGMKSDRDSRMGDRRVQRDDTSRTFKGCACRKSNCTKKYCECFQAGVLCKETCKCIDWISHNNESMTNKNIIERLKRNGSDISRHSGELYPVYLSQNSDHLHSIISQHNPLALKDDWLENSAKQLYESAKNGEPTEVMDSFLDILKKLEESLALRETEEKKMDPQAPNSLDDEPSDKHWIQQPLDKHPQQPQQPESPAESPPNNSQPLDNPHP